MTLEPKLAAAPSGEPVYIGRLASEVFNAKFVGISTPTRPLHFFGVIYRRFADPRAACKDWSLYNSKRLPVTLERHQEFANGLIVIEPMPLILNVVLIGSSFADQNGAL